MKKKLSVVLVLVMLITSLFSGSIAFGCSTKDEVNPIVSTDWLKANSSLKNLVILDVRTSEEYAEGHIANSISAPFVVPFSSWITMKDDLLLELPETSELFQFIGSLGIKKESKVVVVSAATDPYALAASTRVADTLIYAGVKSVSILSGGYTKWVADGKPVTTEVPVVKATVYKGNVDKSMFVTKEYVNKKMGKAVIIDARDLVVYTGDVIEPYADKAGHIPTAKSLPAPDMWNADGTYKSTEELRQLAANVAGKNDKIIVYCGVGGYASSWWYILTQVLGYKHVQFYDGSAQEWVKFYDMIPGGES